MRNACAVLFALLPLVTNAADSPLLQDNAADTPIVQPNIERTDVPMPAVEPRQFELIGSAGLYQADGFSSDWMFSLRGLYQWSKKLFIEASYSQASLNQEPRENLGIPDAFEDDKLSFYNLAAGYNVLSGRGFWGHHYAVSTDFYAVCGVGNTSLDDKSELTISPGIGLRMTPSKWYTVHVDFKGHFISGDLSERSDKLKTNLELSLGVGTYF